MTARRKPTPDLGPSHPPDYKIGPCWVAYCGATVWWPPAHETATIQCSSQYPHTGTVRPATGDTTP
jgi:hypothetical protein